MAMKATAALAEASPFLARFKAARASSASPLVLDNYIDGQCVASQAKQFYDVHDPATQSIISRTPQTTSSELRQALDSAHTAFQSWRTSSVLARQQILSNFSKLLREHQSDIASVIVAENGKTHPDAMGDVLRGIQVVEHATGVPHLLKGDLLEVSRDMDTYSRRTPLGVGAAICAFNFPAMIPLWTIPMAIATGNTLLLKPSERVPSASIIIAELATSAGLPPGVLNIIHGGPDTVNFICDEPQIKAVTFVGGDKAGKHIHTRAGANGKRVQANMGAKNHAVFMPDANRQQSLNALAGAAFGAAGQRCMAISVLVTVGNTSEWLPELIERAKKLNVNQGDVNGADLGPVISPMARERIERLIGSAEKEGGKILLDGRGLKVDGYPDGNWVGPTVIEATTDMTCYKEEIFGPVLIVVKTDNLDHALEIIEKNPYGNGTAVFTNSGATARRFEREVEAGQIGINVPIPVPIPPFAWSGSHASILGGHSLYGQGGLDFWTSHKTVTSLWRAADAVTATADVSMPTHK